MTFGLMVSHTHFTWNRCEDETHNGWSPKGPCYKTNLV